MKQVRNIILRVCFPLTIAFSPFLLSCENSTTQDSTEQNALQSGFVTPPDSIQTSVYWYWISDHISKEGVINDLISMKKVGINRAFIGNIGLNHLPSGKIKVFSDEWWDVLHFALKKATELNIEIGIFNSPGWSQSGGPWIKPQVAMRYLAASEMRVKGPKKISHILSLPDTSFQDVKVLAFPVASGNQIIGISNATFSSTPPVDNLTAAFDYNTETTIPLHADKPLEITLETKEEIILRSLSIFPSQESITANSIFQIKEKGQYKTIKEFTINRSNFALNVGFVPYAPVVISIPETKSKSFRLIIENCGKESRIADILLQSAPQIENFSEKTLAKMWQTPLPLWDAYLWPMQRDTKDASLITRSDLVLDISLNMTSEGLLTWDVPEGEWMIMRTGMVPTGITNAPASAEATGLEVDKMSKEHIKTHFNAFIGEILRRIPEADRKCFKVVVQDSYEMGGQNFTDGFIEDFKRRYNYDPTPYLPCYWGYVINNETESNRFLWDVRRMVADKVAYDYVGGLREVSHSNGLTTWLENYGHWGFPGEFLMYGGQSDEIAGEFWNGRDLGDIENRAATSCGHIYGKNKISAESNTVGGPPYAHFPAMMKERSDRFFAEGINNTLLHVYISQPYEDKNPGVNAWFGNEFNRKNTWFSQLDVFIQYIKRVNFMLQQGLNVADAAYFIGEDAPKMTGITEPPLPVGYQFDYINAEVIKRDLTVKNGTLTLPHGTQYKILVLPPLETMRPELLKKIKQLVYDGAVVLGNAPNRSPSLQNQPEADEQVKQMAQELWGNLDGAQIKSRSFGKGTIIQEMSMNEAMNLIHCIPDCKLPEEHIIHYGHRTLMNGTEIYFLCNQTNSNQSIRPQFRITGMQPELWEPTTGDIRELPEFTQKDRMTEVPLHLYPYESVFIVFRKTIQKEEPSSQNGAKNFPEPILVGDITHDWTVTFDPAQRGPSQPILFDTLKDWTSFADPSIKYYSGTASYRNMFTLDSLTENSEFFIDMGNLTAMGKVYINDRYAGGVWTPPYRLKITPFIKKGENSIKIEVVNNWMNRLIGDQNLPEDQRKVWCLVNPYRKDTPLQSSGLLGPVKIIGFSK